VSYPVNLLVEGRRCLVVGGGAVAARKVEGLRACGAEVHVVATAVGVSVRRQPGITWEERPYRADDLHGCWLVIAATDDPAANEAVYRDGEAAGVWVNSADDPERCTFTLPSVVRRDPVVVAVATGGHSPALASWLRDELAATLGPEHEVLAGLLSDERGRRRAEGGSTEGLDWQKALDSDMLALIKAGQIQQARERLQACLSSSSA